MTRYVITEDRSYACPNDTDEVPKTKFETYGAFPSPRSYFKLMPNVHNHIVCQSHASIHNWKSKTHHKSISKSNVRCKDVVAINAR